MGDYNLHAKIATQRQELADLDVERSNLRFQLQNAVDGLNEARELMAQQVRDLKAQDAEIEVLTTERDNALLRIEELERELSAADTGIAQWRARAEELESDCRDFQQEIGEWSQLAGNQKSEIEVLEQKLAPFWPAGYGDDDEPPR